MTNQFGLFTSEVGMGSLPTGSFSGINWGGDIYYLEVTVDGDVMPASQLLSVPYALHAKTATSGVPGADGHNSLISSTVELAGANCPNGGYFIQTWLDLDDDGTLSAGETPISYYICNGEDGVNGLDGIDGVNGNDGVGITSTVDNGDGTFTINYSDATSFTTSDLTGATGPAGNDGVDGVNGVVYTEGTGISLLGDSITNLGDADADPINELQVLSISNDTISLSNGGSYVVLPSVTADNDWIQGAGSVYNDTDFIGIGTSTPFFALDVVSSDTVVAAFRGDNPDFSAVSIANSNANADVGFILLTGADTAIFGLNPTDKLLVLDNSISGGHIALNADSTVVSYAEVVGNIANSRIYNKTNSIYNETDSIFNYSTSGTIVNVNQGMLLTDSLYVLGNNANNAGYVLTNDGLGQAKWEPSSGGSLWQSNSPNVYFNTGNVGIGTTTPTAPLTIGTVNGSDIEFTGMFNSDISAPSQLNISSGAATMLDAPEMYLRTNNTDRLTILNNGNVGVGTISPQQLLTLSTPASTTFRMERSNASAFDWEMNVDNLGFHIKGGADGTAGALTDFVNVDGFGNIGLGITTPTQLLHLFNGTLRIDDGSNPYNLPTSAGAAGEVLTMNGGNATWQNPGSGADNWGSQVVQVDGTTITGDGDGTPLSGFDGDYGSLSNTPAIPSNTSDLTNDSGFITNANDADADSNNEIQTLSFANPNLSLSNGGGSVDLSGLSGATYTAGTAINISGTTITNTAPDQTVLLQGAGGTSVSGTYPNFTITSTDNVNDADASVTNETITSATFDGINLNIDEAGTPHSIDLSSLQGPVFSPGTGIDMSGNVITNTTPDQVVSLVGAGSTSVSGTYPNFTITSTDNVNDADANATNEIQILSFANPNLSLSNGGGSVDLSGLSTAPIWGQSGSEIHYNSGHVGVGMSDPNHMFHIQDSLASAGTVLMQVDDMIGTPIFRVNNDRDVDVYGNLRVNNAYTFPTSDGGFSGLALITDASGNVSWGTPTAAAGVWSKSGTSIFPTTLTDNVGIGTNTPSVNMHIKDVNPILWIQDSQTGSSAYPRIELGNTTSGTFNSLASIAIPGSGDDLQIAATNSTRFVTNFTERMIIANSGNVGIGTSIPSAKLDVKGSFKLENGNQAVGHVLTSVDANGNTMWKPKNIAFEVGVPGGVTVANSPIVLQFDQIVFNDGGYSTAINGFEPPVDGVYALDVNVMFNLPSTGPEYGTVELWVGGVKYKTAKVMMGNGASASAHISVTTRLTSGTDDVRVVVYSDAQTLEIVNDASTWFSGHLVYAY